MFKESILSLAKTSRSVVKAWFSLAIFAGLCALLLATLYGFIATREATITQVLLTLLFVAAAPLLFFLLQAAIINRARTGRIEWSRALRDACKLALVTLPVILLGAGIGWLLYRWQGHFPGPDMSAFVPAGTPTHWPSVLFATLRVFIFAVALPLILIQLWLAVSSQRLLALGKGGARSFINRLGQILARASSTPAVLIYSLGLIVFGLAPYILLFFVHIPVKGAWSEMLLFATRLVVVFACILFGWVVTLSSLATLHPDPDPITATPDAGKSDPKHDSELEPSAA